MRGAVASARQRAEPGARRKERRLPFLLVALVLTGCASGTRVIHYGSVAPDAHLVTLIVTDSLEVVQRECADAPHAARATLLGCQRTRSLLSKPGEPLVRGVRIVRYTDALPSEMALQIDAHELCHAVASLQFITDPCHADNNGQVEISRAGQLGPFRGAVSR